MTDKIFEGLSHDWKWASWDRSGQAAVHKNKPEFDAEGFTKLYADSCERDGFDRPVPPEGNTPEVLERTDLDKANRPYISPTDGYGVNLVPQPVPTPQPDVRLFNQDVFNEDLSVGALCNYAALNASGVVWLFEIMPTQYGQDFMAPGYSQKLDGKYKAPRAGSGQSVMLQKGVVGEVPIICSQPVVPQPWKGTCKTSNCLNECMQLRDQCETCYLKEVTKPAPPKAEYSPAAAVSMIRDWLAEYDNLGHEPEGMSNYSKGLHNGCEYAIAMIEAREPSFKFSAHEEVDVSVPVNVHYVDRGEDPASLQLNNIRSRVTKLYNVDELTATQVYAILGESPW